MDKSDAGIIGGCLVEIVLGTVAGLGTLGVGAVAQGRAYFGHEVVHTSTNHNININKRGIKC